MPKNNKNMNVEPSGIAIKTRTFRVTISVSSLNNIACDKNQNNGKIAKANVDIPKLKSFFSCVFCFIQFFNFTLLNKR